MCYDIALVASKMMGNWFKQIVFGSTPSSPSQQQQQQDCQSDSFRHNGYWSFQLLLDRPTFLLPAEAYRLFLMHSVILSL
jgi:hypothetical protein